MRLDDDSHTFIFRNEFTSDDTMWFIYIYIFDVRNQNSQSCSKMSAKIKAGIFQIKDDSEFKCEKG